MAHLGQCRFAVDVSSLTVRLVRGSKRQGGRELNPPTAQGCEITVLRTLRFGPSPSPSAPASRGTITLAPKGGFATSAPISAPVPNEAPFCFALMQDGCLHLSNTELEPRLSYRAALRANEQWRARAGEADRSPTEFVCRQRYGASPLVNSAAAVKLLQMAYGVIPLDLTNLVLETDPGTYADEPGEMRKTLNEFERRRLLAQRVPFYEAQLQRAAALRKVRFFVECGIRGEYDFGRAGFDLEVRRAPLGLVAFTNQVRFPAPTFLGLPEREAEQLRRADEQVSIVFEYQGDLVSAEYQRGRAQATARPHGLAVELARLDIHVVRTAYGGNRPGRTVTQHLVQLHFPPGP
jgi:hypothetical protein